MEAYDCNQVLALLKSVLVLIFLYTVLSFTNSQDLSVSFHKIAVLVLAPRLTSIPAVSDAGVLPDKLEFNVIILSWTVKLTVLE